MTKVTTQIFTSAFVSFIVVLALQSPENELLDEEQSIASKPQISVIDKEQIDIVNNQIIQMKQEIEDLKYHQSQMKKSEFLTQNIPIQTQQEGGVKNAQLLLNQTNEATAAKEEQGSELTVIEDDIDENQLSRIFKMNDNMHNLEQDSAWEASAYSQISDQIGASQFVGTTLQVLECQGSMCRMEFFHENESAIESLYSDPFKIVPWNHRGRMELITNEDGGNAESVYYITREGHNFPKG